MIELQGEAFGTLRQTYGGDTFNTAVYLARCGAAAGLEVFYATALGDDDLSERLLERWAADGLRLDLVRRVAGRMPGLYQIETDERGERRFWYWRDTSAARACFDVPTTPLEARAGEWDALYLSGITLAILPPAGRERLFALMEALRARGAMVAFDANYRPRLWPDRAEALDAFARAFERSTLALASVDDLQPLHGLADAAAAFEFARSLATPECVIKDGARPCRVRDAQGRWASVPAVRVERVVDTTAAGDSFAAGYLARRLAGEEPAPAAAFGHRLAALVVQHRGALIPAEAMASLRI